MVPQYEGESGAIISEENWLISQQIVQFEYPMYLILFICINFSITFPLHLPNLINLRWGDKRRFALRLPVAILWHRPYGSLFENTSNLLFVRLG